MTTNYELLIAPKYVLYLNVAMKNRTLRYFAKNHKRLGLSKVYANSNLYSKALNSTDILSAMKEAEKYFNPKQVRAIRLMEKSDVFDDKTNGVVYKDILSFCGGEWHQITPNLGETTYLQSYNAFRNFFYFLGCNGAFCKC